MDMNSHLQHLRQHYATQPFEVSFETLALCNAACRFCPYPTLERKGTRMSDALIASLIEQMADFKKPFYVSPFKVNEPFLDDRLRDICIEIEDECPQATLRLFTNGSVLTERHLEWVNALQRLDCLWVSLNSMDPQEYGEMMKLTLDITTRKLDLLHALAGGHIPGRGFKHKVVVSRVVTDDAKDLAFLSAVLKRWPRFTPVLIKRDAWLGYIVPSRSDPPRSGCSRWFELNVAATGQAVLCCMDGKGEYPQGDVTTQTLLEIYNNPFLTKCRAQHTREGITPCAGCSY